MLILICFFFMPPPSPNAGLTPVNINYVWGLNDAAAQTWMPAWAWVTGMIVLMPILFSCRWLRVQPGMPKALSKWPRRPTYGVQ